MKVSGRDVHVASTPYLRFMVGQSPQNRVTTNWPGRQAVWPLLLAPLFWAAAVALQSPADLAGTALGIALGAVGLAIGLVCTLALRPGPVIRPFAGLIASITSLMALASLDHAARADHLLPFLLAAPWRYALPPLVVHFAMELGWPHRRARWIGWIMGWYAVQAGLWLVSAIGISMSERPLIEAVDGLFRAGVVEPAALATATLALIIAVVTPEQQRMRISISFAIAALLLGILPLLLVDLVPALDLHLVGAMTPGRMALMIGVIGSAAALLAGSLRDSLRRDLGAHQLAVELLGASDLQPMIQRIADTVRGELGANGVALRIAEPAISATSGNVDPTSATAALAHDIEGDEQSRTTVFPIGRTGDPLGDLRIENVTHGMLGQIDREWVRQFLQPIDVALRMRRREIMAAHRAEALARHWHQGISQLAEAAQRLPSQLRDPGTGVPPPVDAREVLAQLSEGVSGVARHGEAVQTTATEARQRARVAADTIARALDDLARLAAMVAELHRHADGVSASNESVTGVAFRTNLVANNASLEASRAGGAGRTFGVLAEEVRRLADTTAAASVAIGRHTESLAEDLGRVGADFDRVRQSLAAAIRESEAGELAAQRLSDTATELDDAAHSLDPALTEANAVARRRSARDQHLTETLERFLNERASLARALIAHHDAMQGLVRALDAVFEAHSG